MRIFAIACALAALFAASQSPARADFRPKVEVVAIQGRPVIHVNHRPAIGLDDFDRAGVVAGRLNVLIDRGLDPRALSAIKTQSGWAVVAGDTRIVGVTNREAKDRGANAESLARSWAANLKDLLSLPGLVATPPRLLIPLGETRSVRIGGAATGPLSIRCDNPNAAVKVDQEQRTITVAGAIVTDGVISVACEGATLDVPFAVRRYAAHIGDARIGFTGNGPSRERLTQLVQQYALRAVAVEPGAKASIDGPVALPAIPASVKVPVRAEGENYIPVRGEVTISIERENLISREAAQLYYSNDPEQVRQYGTLFAAPLNPSAPVRLLYHHQNMMPNSFTFSVALVNYGSTPVKLQVVEGIANPLVDTVQVGHRAAAWFLRSLFTDSGYVIDINPNEAIPLLAQSLQPRCTASGIYQFRLLSGGPVWIFVRAQESGWDLPAQPPPPSTEIYASPTRRIDEQYQVGGRWAFIPIGKHAIKSAAGDGALEGNYGVLYDIRVRVTNPTNSPTVVDVLFEPSAGIARGVFWIDGQPVETQHMLPPKEYPLARFQIAAGATRDVRILTMPLAGSNYPARLIVREDRVAALQRAKQVGAAVVADPQPP